MNGIKFPQQTTVFGKPKDWKDEDCYGLPVAQTVYNNSQVRPVACLISCWESELTDEQIADIIRTRKVRAWLSITGKGMPPVSISLADPFPAEYDKDLGLQNHKEAF